MKYRQLINYFLRGYNGIDDLFYLNFWLIIICLILDIFINNIYLSLTLVALVILIIYRVFSRNISKRRKENNIYLSIIKWPKNKIKLYSNIIKNYNKNLYKRCPKCKQMIKLPLKKGKHQVICPSCKHEFTVKCNRNEKVKVEIIRDR